MRSFPFFKTINNDLSSRANIPKSRIKYFFYRIFNNSPCPISCLTLKKKSNQQNGHIHLAAKIRRVHRIHSISNYRYKCIQFHAKEKGGFSKKNSDKDFLPLSGSIYFKILYNVAVPYLSLTATPLFLLLWLNIHTVVR